MSGVDTPPDAVAFLCKIAGELVEIHCGSDYSLWRGEAKNRVNQYLSSAESFSLFAICWAFSGDGGGSIAGGYFGEWAIDRLVEKMAPEDIVALFTDEVARNAVVYEDVSSVPGIEITKARDLGEGISLVSSFVSPSAFLQARLRREVFRRRPW